MTRASDAPPRAAAEDRPPSWLVVALLLPIALGIWLRCEGLDRRPLWYDEVATVLRISGRTAADVRRTFDGRPHEAGALLRDFQRPRDGGLASGAAAVLRSVAADEPQSGPGYFVAAYLALRGRDVTRNTARIPSTVASIAALALIGALAGRLFGDRVVALATVALAAVSPLQIRYAQEARGYALWSGLLLAATLALLAAGAHRSVARWLVFAVLFAASCLVHALSLLAVPALVLLASATRGNHRAARSATAPALGGIVIAVALWTPWLVVALASRDAAARTTAWAAEPVGLASLARSWAGVTTSIFYRPGGPGGLLDGAPPSLAGIAWLLLGGAAVLGSAYALVTCARHAPGAARRFVPALAVVPFATLALADLLGGGRRSAVDRYLLPSWLALELAIGFALASPGPRRLARRLVLVAILLLGAATALRTQPLDAWWNTDGAGFATWRAVERAVAQDPQAVVVTDADPLAVLELAHRLPSETRLRLGGDAASLVPADEWAHALLVRPSDGLLERATAALPADRMLTADPGGLPLWSAAERR